MLQDQVRKLAEEILSMRNEESKLQGLIQRQDKALVSTKSSIYEDKQIIERMEKEREKLANHVAELERDVRELIEELNREKGNVIKLQEVVCTLNLTKKKLEEEVNLMKIQQNCLSTKPSNEVNNSLAYHALISDS